MALSVFDDKSKPPGEDELARTLGKAFKSWNDLKVRLAARIAPLDEEWGFTSKSTGWGLRLRHKERVIVYMTPRKGHFLASFALGQQAVDAAHERKLSAVVLATIDAAKQYAEGRGVRLEVRNEKDVRGVEELAIIKLEN